MAKISASPAPKKTPAKAAAPAQSAIAYGVRTGFRPGAGALLFAYTDAWLSASGMAQGGTLDRAAAEKVAGATAIGYHLGKGNLSEAKGLLSLTPSGKAFFAARGADPKLAAAFAEALRTGKPNPDVKLKVEAAFVKLG